MSRGDMITPAELPEALKSIEPETENPGLDVSPGMPLREVEKQLILKTLEETGGNRTHAAEKLGISRRTLQLKIKSYKGG